MTIDEKIASLNTSGVVVPRLGIPGTPIGEAISGVVAGGPMIAMQDAIARTPPDQRTPAIATTQFPQGVGLARTWDRALMPQAGKRARQRGAVYP
jgi:beta-glucosidase-like glycosyl hydrolase